MTVNLVPIVMFKRSIVEVPSLSASSITNSEQMAPEPCGTPWKCRPLSEARAEGPVTSRLKCCRSDRLVPVAPCRQWASPQAGRRAGTKRERRCRPLRILDDMGWIHLTPPLSRRPALASPGLRAHENPSRVPSARKASKVPMSLAQLRPSIPFHLSRWAARIRPSSEGIPMRDRSTIKENITAMW